MTELTYHTTNDLSVFKRLATNRRVDPSNVARLEKAIKERNMLMAHPIVVNRSMEVLDGQNRLEAARRLGVPVSYVIMDSDADQATRDVIMMNNTRCSWKTSDYVDSFIAQRNEDYLKLRQLCDAFNLTIDAAVEWCGDISADKIRIKSGDFRYQMTAEDEADLEICLGIREALIANNTRFRILTRSKAFHRACRLIFNSHFINPRELLLKVQERTSPLRPARTILEWVELLVDIWNYNKREWRLLVHSRGAKIDIVRAK